jgi:hypothetical protein
MANDAVWKGVGMPSANAGTAAMGMAGDLFNKALATAEGGLTKHQEETEKNTAAERAANTALVLKMKSEGKPVSKAFLDQLGVYDGKEINDGSLTLRKEQQENMKNAAQIANWKSQQNQRDNSMQDWLQKEMIKDKMDKDTSLFNLKYGINQGTKKKSGYSGKKGKGSGNSVDRLSRVAKWQDTYGIDAEEASRQVQEIDARVNKAVAAGIPYKQAKAAAESAVISNIDYDWFTPNDLKSSFGW